jgi:small conductance mechanosensitive channel
MNEIDLDNLDLENIDTDLVIGYLEKLYDLVLGYIPTLVLALVVLLIGKFFIKYINKALTIFFAKADFDEALERFAQSFIVVGLKIILFILVFIILGVKTSSFVAVFGAMVFAVGMALQGSLSNFAGGVLILFFKPFRLGDFIVSGGHSGKVIDIQIFNTILKTSEGIRIILPNGPVSNDTIINKTNITKRRVEFIIGVSYSDDIKKVKKVLKEIARDDKRISKEEDVLVAVRNLGDNAVEILFRF